MPTVREALAAIEAALEKSSPLPIFVNPSTDQLHVADVSCLHNTIADDMLIWDAECYAELRNHAPALIAAVSALSKALERISKAKPDELNHALDVAIIERAANIARAALAQLDKEL